MNLKETYTIFICERDFFGIGAPLYHIERKITETGANFDDGAHIIYVNCEYTGTDTDIGRLIHDIRETNPEKILDETVRDRVKTFKEAEEGDESMSDLYMNTIGKEMEERGMEKGVLKGIQSGIIESAKRLLTKGLPLDYIIDMLSLNKEQVALMQTQ